MGSSEQELDEILAVMRAVPGVIGVCKSAYTGPDLNKMNVFFRYQPPGGGAKVPVRVPCSADLPDKLAAAKVARDKVITIFGEEAVAKAEKQVRETAAIGSSMASPSLAPAAEASAASASASGDAFAIKRSKYDSLELAKSTFSYMPLANCVRRSCAQLAPLRPCTQLRLLTTTQTSSWSRPRKHSTFIRSGRRRL